MHLIVENKAVADLLIDEWLLTFTAKYANRKGQDMRPIYNRTTGLIEIEKYGSKIFTEPDIDKKQKGKQRDLYAAALFNIFHAMKGKRIFERFGFNLPPELGRKQSSLTHITGFDNWAFDIKSFDWINSQNNERLTNYIPLPSLLELLQNRVNTQEE